MQITKEVEKPHLLNSCSAVCCTVLYILGQVIISELKAIFNVVCEILYKSYQFACLSLPLYEVLPSSLMNGIISSHLFIWLMWVK